MIEEKEMTIYDKLLQKVNDTGAGSYDFIDPSLREAAREEFLSLGIPTIKNEEWKFTNVQPFLKADYEIFSSDKDEYIDILAVSDLLTAHLDAIQEQLKGEPKGAYRLVLLNGRIVKDLSYLPEEEAMTVAHFSESKAAALKEVGSIAHTKGNAFASLNTCLAEEGVYLSLKAGQQLDRPFHIVHLFDLNKPSFYNGRVWIELGQAASMELIETHLNKDSHTPVFLNKVYEINLQEQAVLDHYDIQKGTPGIHQVKITEARQAVHSNYSNYTFSLPGGSFYRNNLAIHIEARDTECHLYGLYLATEKQLIDNHTEVHHKYPNCESNQLYKGILLDESKAVFNGKIFVYQDAQKTNAFQKSNNILLSDRATINAKPQLEIFADDVKCSHGSTVGRLDQNAVFYLKSRGIGEESAKKMMVNAFAYDVTQKVKNPSLRHYLEEQISREIR